MMASGASRRHRRISDDVEDALPSRLGSPACRRRERQPACSWGSSDVTRSSGRCGPGSLRRRMPSWRPCVRTVHPVFLDQADDQVDHGIFMSSQASSLAPVVVGQQGVRASSRTCGARVGGDPAASRRTSRPSDVTSNASRCDGNEPAPRRPGERRDALGLGGSLRGLGARGLEFDPVHVGRSRQAPVRLRPSAWNQRGRVPQAAIPRARH